MPEPLEIKMEDENGVDVASGFTHFSVDDVELAGLRHSIRSIHGNYVMGFPKGAMGDSFHGGLGYYSPIPGGGQWDYRPSWVVGMGGGGETFFINPNGTLEATKGGSLVADTPGVNIGSLASCGNTGIWTYTAGDGAIMKIDTSKGHVGLSGGPRSVAPGFCGVATKITYPNGLIVDINVKSRNDRYSRIQSVTRNDGFQLKYNYVANAVDDVGFLELQSVVAVNNAFETCDPMADTCALPGIRRQSSYAWTTGAKSLTVTNQGGGATRFTLDRFDRVVGVKPPTSAVDKVNYEYCARPPHFGPGGVWLEPTPAEQAQMCSVTTFVLGGSTPGINITNVHDRTRKVTRDGLVWTYNFPSGMYGYYYLKYDSVAPNGETRMALSTILGTGALLVVGSSEKVANFENSSRNRMTSAQLRGGPLETYSYDARGNMLSDGITSADFAATCANINTCNKPVSVKDPAQNETSYTYYDHGGVRTETGPMVNNIRPQKRFDYVQRYAWFRNAAGVMTRSADPIWKLASESFCRNSAATGNPAAPCAGNDEVLTTYDYGPDSGPNNLLTRGKVMTADGVSLRTCYGYDQYANKISETEPKAGLTVCA
ncbi:hypothetical protein Q9Q95_03855 [Sphingomonas sp. DG1-23]|uniref:hypothetical protein n=1 Tax=Sphingomonas sp. DG1-23 TaxID=3068316 RepID=UPI00273E6064|nr:hypothetical protein [Sphingomonas sp. DG1-23]MDP5278047.1 hypothetical protein [Sphingomonas sp. DG1-23]